MLDALDVQIVEIARLDPLQVHQGHLGLVPVLCTVGAQDLIPELDLVQIVGRNRALFADRADITEEVVRLKSHNAQFSAELQQPNSGRKLDFLIQELLREVNTIGSKASEIATTKLVLEAKTEIERVREQVQNLE